MASNSADRSAHRCFGTWPWALPKLGTAQPVVLNLDNGIQVDQIAACTPDLIVATNAGLDSDTYAKLTAIAPTIAQAGQDAFFEPWTVQASTIGQAVFKYEEMKNLVANLQRLYNAHDGLKNVCQERLIPRDIEDFLNDVEPPRFEGNAECLAVIIE